MKASINKSTDDLIEAYRMRAGQVGVGIHGSIYLRVATGVVQLSGHNNT